ncbi:MAG: hypothetical protein DMG59_28895 [Acidobacteria bacterium]|nr:MAG: hypothetical protein DMG59_28895 [Acidobacteriota bacterium]
MNTPVAEQPFEVLLAEDHPGDVRLTREALKGSAVRINLSVAANGEETLAFLRRQGNYTGATRPSMVLLDLNMPKKNGWEVLLETKKDPELDCIPVVILTTSGAQEDIVRSYKLHANAYITKPNRMDRWAFIVKAMEEFLLHVARLPHTAARRKKTEAAERQLSRRTSRPSAPELSVGSISV